MRPGTAAVTRDATLITDQLSLFGWSNAGEVCGPLRVPQGQSGSMQATLRL